MFISPKPDASELLGSKPCKPKFCFKEIDLRFLRAAFYLICSYFLRYYVSIG